MNKQKITNPSQNVNPNLDKINFLRVARYTQFSKSLENEASSRRQRQKYYCRKRKHLNVLSLRISNETFLC